MAEGKEPFFEMRARQPREGYCGRPPFPQRTWKGWGTHGLTLTLKMP
jgi:hypothetical protein